MNCELPISAELGGVEYSIRWDYRAALDICAALADPELTDSDKAEAALEIFYPERDDIPAERQQEALELCFRFLSLGEEGGGSPSPKVMDWEQDFRFIAPAVSRVLGREIRGPDKLHWWTFVGAYYEIGDCLFAQIVSIRDKKARGKKLEKSEAEWYRRNRDIVDLKVRYTQAELEALEALGLKS